MCPYFYEMLIEVTSFKNFKAKIFKGSFSVFSCRGGRGEQVFVVVMMDVDSYKYNCIGIFYIPYRLNEYKGQMDSSPSTITRLALKIALKGSVNDRPRPDRVKVMLSNQNRLIQFIASPLRDRFLKAAETAQSIQGVGGRHLSASRV